MPRSEADRWFTFSALAGNALTALAVAIVAFQLSVELALIFASSALVLSVLSNWVVTVYLRKGGGKPGPPEPPPTRDAGEQKREGWRITG